MSLAREFLRFLLRRKRYWLVPWIVILVLLALLLYLGGGTAAPFVYDPF